MKHEMTMEQLMVIKKMTEIGEAFCNQIYHIMQNHGLDKIPGCQMKFSVCPEYKGLTKEIEIGNHDSDFGRCAIACGVNENKYSPYGRNDPVYEWLFADDAIKEQMAKIVWKTTDKSNMKPIPPDGLWVGDDYKGEW